MKAEIAKWADEAVREGRRVRVIDVNSKKKFFNPVPFFITAVEDTEQRTLLLGSELNGSEEGEFKARKGRIFDAAKKLILRDEVSKDNQDEEVSAQISITHLQSFDLSKDKDAAIFYLIILNSDAFASAENEINPQTHRFWVEDRRRESANKRSEIQVKVNALEVLRKQKPEETEAIYRLILGNKPDGLSYQDQLADLEIFADENPVITAKALSDPKLNAKIFAMHLMNAGIVKYQRYTGSYYDGDNKIGNSLDALVDYITAPENSKLRDSWGKLIKKNGSYKSGNVSEPAGSTAEA